MSRSRSFNRFHRFLARQKRRGLRDVLPSFREGSETMGPPVNYSRELLSKQSGREIELELLEGVLLIEDSGSQISPA